MRTHPGLWVIAGFGTFILAGIILMWWAIGQDRYGSCHPVQAQRAYADGRNGASTQCL